MSRNPKLTITLTGRPPVTVTKAEWPIIAISKVYDGKFESDSKNIRCVTVRENDDGRVIVYAWYKTKEDGMSGYRGGVMTEAPVDDASIVGLINAVTLSVLGKDHKVIGEKCIAQLPPEEIS